MKKNKTKAELYKEIDELKAYLDDARRQRNELKKEHENTENSLKEALAEVEKLKSEIALHEASASQYKDVLVKRAAEVRDLKKNVEELTHTIELRDNQLKQSIAERGSVLHNQHLLKENVSRLLDKVKSQADTIDMLRSMSVWEFVCYKMAKKGGKK